MFFIYFIQLIKKNHKSNKNGRKIDLINKFLLYENAENDKK